MPQWHVLDECRLPLYVVCSSKSLACKARSSLSKARRRSNLRRPEKVFELVLTDEQRPVTGRYLGQQKETVEDSNSLMTPSISWHIRKEHAAADACPVQLYRCIARGHRRWRCNMRVHYNWPNFDDNLKNKFRYLGKKWRISKAKEPPNVFLRT